VLAETRMLIAGKLTAAAGGEWLDAVEPATENVIGRVAAGDGRDVTAAVDAAEAAWQEWFRAGNDARRRCLQTLADRIDEAADEIVDLEVRDSGNTVDKVRADVDKTISGIRHITEIASEAKGTTVPGDGDHLHMTLREPYGVVARIVPFNHPIMFGASRIAAPLMAGNAVVLKAPEQASLSIGRLAEICEDVFPPGVVNIVTGLGVPVGDALVRDPRVRRVAFTGSVPTGLAIMRAAGESSVKALSLELGGKNPFVVLPDADIEQAAKGAVSGMNFAWQGQSCGSTSRVLVHRDRYEAFVEQVGDRVRGLRVGDPGDAKTDMGPVVTREHLARVRGFVEAAPAQGAKLLAGGGRPTGDAFDRGYWIEPTAFAGVDPSSSLFQDEIFGPVMAITPYRDLEEAIGLANGVQYALTASIWTSDLDAALRLATRIRAGYVWVNEVSRRYRGLPFGGFDNSGIGREEGLEEILSYSAPKTVNLRFDGGGSKGR
jgi:betaine-aldehyde dehydrogenase